MWLSQLNVYDHFLFRVGGTVGLFSKVDVEYEGVGYDIRVKRIRDGYE